MCNIESDLIRNQVGYRFLARFQLQIMDLNLPNPFSLAKTLFDIEGPRCCRSEIEWLSHNLQAPGLECPLEQEKQPPSLHS